MNRTKDILNKYSDIYIKNFFYAQIMNNKQFSYDVQNDFIKKQNMCDEMIIMTIRLRDACVQPTLKENENIIRNHHMYIHDCNDRLNSQLRGPQCDLAHNIFRDMALAGNGINKTTMNGLSFSQDLVIDNTKVDSCSVVQIPKNFALANSDSFKHGIEIVNSNVVSAVTGYPITLTGDSLVRLPVGIKPINNLPKRQNFGDACWALCYIYRFKK